MTMVGSTAFIDALATVGLTPTGKQIRLSKDRSRNIPMFRDRDGHAWVPAARVGRALGVDPLYYLKGNAERGAQIRAGHKVFVPVPHWHHPPGVWLLNVAGVSRLREISARPELDRDRVWERAYTRIRDTMQQVEDGPLGAFAHTPAPTPAPVSEPEPPMPEPARIPLPAASVDELPLSAIEEACLRVIHACRNHKQLAATYGEAAARQMIGTLSDALTTQIRTYMTQDNA